MTQTIKKFFLIFVLALAMPVGVAFGDCVSDTMNALRNGDLTNSPEFRAFEKSITDSENKKYNTFANKIPGYMNGLMDLKENGNVVATIQVVCTGTQKYSECEYTCIMGDCDENPKQTFIARQSGARVGKQLTGYIYREYSTEYCSNLAQYRGRMSMAPGDDKDQNIISETATNTQYRTISGTITDANTNTGTGLAGITVTANKVHVTTNANGKYAISVPTSVLTMSVSDPNKHYNDTKVTIKSDTTTKNITMDGKVCTLSIANAQYAAYRDNKCTVTLCKSGYEPNADKTKCQELKTTSVRTIIGVITDENTGNPLPGITVYTATGKNAFTSVKTDTGSLVKTDTNGMYKITNVPDTVRTIYFVDPNKRYMDKDINIASDTTVVNYELTGLPCNITNASSAEYRDNKCTVISCSGNYTPSKTNDSCEPDDDNDDKYDPLDNYNDTKKTDTSSHRGRMSMAPDDKISKQTIQNYQFTVIDVNTRNNLSDVTVTNTTYDPNKHYKTNNNGSVTFPVIPETDNNITLTLTNYETESIRINTNDKSTYQTVELTGRNCKSDVDNAKTAQYRDKKCTILKCADNSYPQNNECPEPQSTTPPAPVTTTTNTSTAQPDKPKPEKPVAQTRTITGTVKDKLSGNNLSGIRVKDTASGKSATTDKNGKFSISGVADTGPVNLVIESSHYTGGVSVSTTNDAGIISATGNDCTKSIAHATNAYYQDNKCTLQECADGYDPKNNKCEKKTEEKNTPARSAATQTEPKTKTATQPQVKSDTHNISGTVIDKRSRNPLSGVNVCVNSNCVNTESDGTFTLSDVTKNTARLTFTVNNYKSDYKTVYGFQDKIGNFALEGIECKIDNGTSYYQDNACKLNKCNKGYTQDGNTCVEKTTNTNSKTKSAKTRDDKLIDVKPILGDEVVTTSQNNQITETKTRTITGTVTEEFGYMTELSGVTVTDVATGKSVKTKSDGTYSIYGVSDDDVTLRFTRDKYAVKAETIHKGINTLDVKLIGQTCTPSNAKQNSGYYSANYGGCCAEQNSCNTGYQLNVCSCEIIEQTRNETLEREKEEKQAEKDKVATPYEIRTAIDKAKLTNPALARALGDISVSGNNQIECKNISTETECKKQTDKCLWTGNLCITIPASDNCSGKKQLQCKKKDGCEWKNKQCVKIAQPEMSDDNSENTNETETKCNKLKDKNECDANTACSWNGKRCTTKKAEKKDKEAPTENDNNAPSAKSGSNTTDKSEQPTTNNNQQQPVATRPRYTAEDVERLEKDLKEKKETEQSLENRTLAATSMAATGAGMMATMTAAAEKQADEDAERDMRAYLATFTCDYGGGKTYRGGETGIELPRANNLIGLYTEYAKLSADLAERKSALGLRPGIESAVVIDKATTNMYGDATTSGARPSGAYASIARAILDPESEDAKQWAAQRAATDTKLKAGIAASVAGVATGVIGNIAINAIKKREVPTQALQDMSKKSAQATPVITKNEIGEEIPANNSVPPVYTTSPVPQQSITQTVATPTERTKTQTEIECATAKEQDPLVTYLIWEDACYCKNQFAWNNETKKCECHTELPDYKIVNGICKDVETETIYETLETGTFELNLNTGTNTNTTTVQTADYREFPLYTSGLFKVRSAEFANENVVNEILVPFFDKLKGYKSCNLILIGYADPSGGETINKPLSENRANAVKDWLENQAKQNNNSPKLNITTIGRGARNCKCGVISPTQYDGVVTLTAEQEKHKDYKECKNKDVDTVLPYSSGKIYAPCRRIEVKADCELKTTQTETITTPNN